MNDFENSLNHVLVETFNGILKYEETSLKKISNIPVTIGEAHMIEAIGNQEDRATVSRLAALMNIAMPTATVAVKKLEQKGLVKKVPCEVDGRRTIVSLTEMGKKIDRAHRFFHEKMTKNISGQFLDAEKEILLKAIQKLNEFFKIRVEAEA